MTTPAQGMQFGLRARIQATKKLPRPIEISNQVTHRIATYELALYRECVASAIRYVWISRAINPITPRCRLGGNSGSKPDYCRDRRTDRKVAAGSIAIGWHADRTHGSWPPKREQECCEGRGKAQTEPRGAQAHRGGNEEALG